MRCHVDSREVRLSSVGGMGGGGSEVGLRRSGRGEGQRGYVPQSRTDFLKDPDWKSKEVFFFSLETTRKWKRKKIEKNKKEIWLMEV